MLHRLNFFAYRREKKCVAVFLLALEAIFLNVIVPGHHRGVITLDGKNSVRSLADLGCPFCGPPVSNNPKNAPTRQDRQDCAICHLAVRLSISPPFDLHIAKLWLLEIIPPPAAESATVAAAVWVHDCRGPPLLCV